MTRPVSDDDRTLDPSKIYELHANFVWRSLQRCGLSSGDLEDAFQEVFVVVQTKLHTFRGDSKITTWLFGICLRVTKKQRRFAFFRNFSSEKIVEVVDTRTPERDLDQRRTGELVERTLSRLTPEQRAVFTMFELEEIDCAEIAETVGVPVGTIYSRLHAARDRFRREYERCSRTPLGSLR